MRGPRNSDVPARKAIERLLVRRVAILGNIDVIAASYASHRFPPHAHADCVFAVVEGGVGQVWREGRTDTATDTSTPRSSMNPTRTATAWKTQECASRQRPRLCRKSSRRHLCNRTWN